MNRAPMLSAPVPAKSECPELLVSFFILFFAFGFVLRDGFLPFLAAGFVHSFGLVRIQRSIAIFVVLLHRFGLTSFGCRNAFLWIKLSVPVRIELLQAFRKGWARLGSWRGGRRRLPLDLAFGYSCNDSG